MYIFFSDGLNTYFLSILERTNQTRTDHTTTRPPVQLWYEKQAHENAWTELPGPGGAALTKGTCSHSTTHYQKLHLWSTGHASSDERNGRTRDGLEYESRRFSSTGQPLPNTTLVVKSKTTVLGRTRVEWSRMDSIDLEQLEVACSQPDHAGKPATP